MNENVELIPIEKIVIDYEFYPRIRVNWLTVYSYRQAIKAGANMPPICVVKDADVFILIDGAHRYNAFKNEKAENILAEILDIPKNEWYIESIKRNIKNALPFSPFEKRQIIINLREMKIPDDNIMKIVQMPKARFEKFLSGSFIKRENMSTLIVKAPLKNIINTNNLTSIIESEQRIINAHTQANILDQLINIIRNDWLNIEDENIVQRLNIIYRIISAKYNSIIFEPENEF